MKSLSVTIQMKATEQYFPVVLFIMLYKVVRRSEPLSLRECKGNQPYAYVGPIFTGHLSTAMLPLNIA